VTDSRSGKVLAIMALAAAAVLVVGAGVGAAATTWYVDDDGGDGVDFTKIQDAVDAASDEDTIEVRSGAYYESVDLNRRLVLRGVDTGEGKPVVDAEGDMSPIAVMVDGCTVDGFNVTGSEDAWEYAGIRVESNNNTITNNLINFNQGRGIILITPSKNNTITTNEIYSNDAVGICLRDDCVDNWFIDNNVLFNGDHGIELGGDCTNSTLINNNICFNGEIGIYIIECDNAILTNNTASNNEEGIFLDDVKNCILRDNSINNNTYNFNVKGGGVHDIDTSNTINGKPIYYLIDQENVVIDSSWNAGYVGVVDSNDITVRDLTMTGNGQGIIFYEVEDSRIENVNVMDNIYGICLIGSRGITLKNNAADSNEECGLLVDWGYDNSIDTSNTVNGKPVQYFYDIHDQTISNLNITHLTIAESSNIIIRDNNISNGDGIYLSGIEDSVISNNIVSDNFYGMVADRSDNNTFRNNSANRNKDTGMHIHWDSNNNTIVNNHADENEQYGIEIGGGKFNSIMDNHVTANKKHGIRLSHAGNNIVSGNYAAFNSRAGILAGYDSKCNKIANNNASFNDCGMYVWYSSDNNTIANNTLSYNHNGIFLYEVDNNEFINNTISNNSGKGIHVRHSNCNSITSNVIFDNDYSGMDIDCTTNDNMVTGNSISSNGDNGIGITHSNNNTIIDNTISLNGHTGIRIKLANDNKIFHNNFLNNANQADDNGNNFWDNGYRSGGNYWSDHFCTGNPSDGSQPYTISGGAGAVDRYPFESVNGWSTTSQTGDLNGDGILTPADAAIALRLAATGAQNSAADVSGDHRVTSLDALMILQAAAGGVTL